ncbi:MAG: haloacid dehalogenase-like hydrolase [Opitutaceae bacterium]|nr:haloacid dehalogenase-like hydrolase [Opitutaceae bacterium]
MVIGIDLDNTLICYDASFHAAAVARGLIPATSRAQKAAVKAAVLANHDNATWTTLQGEVYGPLLPRATAYPGAADFLRHCRASGHAVCILSHKSRVAALQPHIDLRSAALGWIQSQGWLDAPAGLHCDDIEFLDTRSAKIDAIARRACELFIDDLPEVFAEPGFPAQTTAFLFDPDAVHPVMPGLRRFTRWSEISTAVCPPTLA